MLHGGNWPTVWPRPQSYGGIEPDLFTETHVQNCRGAGPEGLPGNQEACDEADD
jgi:hypothetical protein